MGETSPKEIEFYRNYEPAFIEHIQLEVLSQEGWSYLADKEVWSNKALTVAWPYKRVGLIDLIEKRKAQLKFFKLGEMEIKTWKTVEFLRYNDNYLSVPEVMNLVRLANGRATKPLMERVVIGSTGDTFPALIYVPFDEGPETLMFVLAPVVVEELGPERVYYDLPTQTVKGGLLVPEVIPPKMVPSPPRKEIPEMVPIPSPEEVSPVSPAPLPEVIPAAPPTPPTPPTPPRPEEITLEQVIEQIGVQPDIQSATRVYLQYNPLKQFNFQAKRTITEAYTARKREIIGLGIKPTARPPARPPPKPIKVPEEISPEGERQVTVDRAIKQIRAILKAHSKWDKPKEDVLTETHDLYGTSMDILEEAWAQYRRMIEYAERGML